MIGVLGAMPVEAAPYLQRLQNERQEQVGGLTFHLGTLFDTEVAVLCCGVGKVNAAMGAQALIQRYNPQLVLHSGVGGALSPKMKIAELVIAKNCIQFDVDTTALGDPLGMVSTVDRIHFPCAPAIVEKLNRLAGEAAYSGTVATSDRFLTHAEDKQFVASKFEALSCDQESCAIAQVCYVNHMPCAVVRAISDVTDEANAVEYRDNVGEAAVASAKLILLFLEKFGKEF